MRHVGTQVIKTTLEYGDILSMGIESLCFPCYTARDDSCGREKDKSFR